MENQYRCSLCGHDDNRIYLCDEHQETIVDSFASSRGVLPWDDVEESRPRQASEVKQLKIAYDNHTINSQGESKRFL